MSTIDLHTHSDYSDGRQTPGEVFELAAKSGVKTIALTDHDSTRGLLEAREHAARLGMQLVVGAEVTTVYEGGVLHVLAYKFDLEHSALQSVFQTLSEGRKSGVLAVVRRINEQLGGVVDEAAFMESQKGYFNRWKLVDYLVSTGVVHSREEAVELTKGISIATGEITTKAAIEHIHDAGGIAVLAHGFSPKTSISERTADIAEQGRMIKEIVGYGLDGIECYQPSHLDEGVQRALVVAKEFGLLVTGGTDWHGHLSQVGESIKSYIPNYADYPGGFTVPEAVQSAMRDILC